MGAWLPGVEALRVLGLSEMRRGNDALVERAYEEGLERARAIPFPYVEARILHASGLLDRQRGDVASARVKLSEALAIMERLGAMRHAEAFRKNMGAADKRTPRG
jgi:hypothetical protein